MSPQVVQVELEAGGAQIVCGTETAARVGGRYAHEPSGGSAPGVGDGERAFGEAE